MHRCSLHLTLLRRSFVLAFFVAALYASPYAYAQDDDAESVTSVTKDTTRDSTGGAGDLLVAPTRVLLEDRARSAQITLSNTGSKEATYRVSFTHLHMDDNGKYEEVSESKLPALGEKSADELLRFSPRQVTLKPGESQTIKIVVRLPDQLAHGEYRSHLSFSAVPDTAIGEDVEAKNVKPDQIGIRLVPIYGVSIPVVVREGHLTAEAGITNVKAAGKSLSFTLTRSGDKSLYGDVIATYEGKVVGESHGVAVFVPNQKRNMTLHLDEPVNGGSLTIEYLAREGDGQTLAKTTTKL